MCLCAFVWGRADLGCSTSFSLSLSAFCCHLIIESHFLLSSNSKFFDSFWEAGALEHIGEVSQSETGRSVSLEVLSLVSGTSVRDFPPGPMYIQGKWKPVAQRLPGAGECETEEIASHIQPPEGHSWRRESLKPMVSLLPVLTLATFRKMRVMHIIDSRKWGFGYL